MTTENKKSKSKNILDYFNNNETSKSEKRKFERRTYNLGDGAIVQYLPNYVIDPDALFQELLNTIPWKHGHYIIHDREVSSPRLMHVIYYDEDDYYSSDDESNNHISSKELHLPELDKIKKRIEKITKKTFNYAVCNYYRNGNDHIGYHSDKENPIGNTVVSVTVGATRRFYLKHKIHKDVKYKYMLAHGDVLVLNHAAISGKFLHSVPVMKGVGPRINITFRE